MTQIVEWFFGRGLSIGCGLTWAVPAEWHALHRADQIESIKRAVRSKMAGNDVNTVDIQYFLDLLANYTVAPWRHQFHTTNWDYLLQRKIRSLGHTVQPPWCAETHVYHWNGTVEELADNSHRSAIVLESDPPSARVATTEGNIAFNKFVWSQTFVVVGMTFECDVDKFLLTMLQRVEDDLPIGESYWIVVNPSVAALNEACLRLQAALPRAKIIGVAKTFGMWLRDGVPVLRSRGAIAL